MRRAARSSLRWAAVAALVVALGAAGTPATAADGDLLVSADGATYTTGNTLPLFPDAWRFVPGDVQHAWVWVQNAGATPATLRIDLVNPTTTDPLFADNVTIAAAPDGALLAPVRFASAIHNGACTVLNGTRVIGPGESVRIDVEAAVSNALTGTQAERARLSFSLRANLADTAATVPAQPGDACLALPDDGGGTRAAGKLPPTGASIVWPLALLAAAGIGGGAAAVLVGRRRRRNRDEAAHE